MSAIRGSSQLMIRLGGLWNCRFLPGSPIPRRSHFECWRTTLLDCRICQLSRSPTETSFRVTSSLISEVKKYLPTFPERTQFVPLTPSEFLIRGNCFHMSWTICDGDTVRFSKDQ